MVNNKNKQFNFKQKKDHTILSLKEVNSFLCNLNLTLKSVKIFKWIK